MTRIRWAVATGFGVLILSAVALFTLFNHRSPVGPKPGGSDATFYPASGESRADQNLSLHLNAGKNVLLGDIATVPFQELYDLLLKQKPEEIAELARQLEDVPPGVARDAKINAFFKVWVAIDAKAAVEIATKFRDRPARNAAFAAAVEGAAPSSTGTVVEAILQLPPRCDLRKA